MMFPIWMYKYPVNVHWWQAGPVVVPGGWELLLVLGRGRQSLWWSLVAGTALGGCGEPWLCWYCAGGLWGALALLVLCWGAVGSPGFAGTVLGGCGEPWLCWYCAGGLWGALALLVLCWGAVGSPGFTGTVLGGCGELWLYWYCAGGLWGALALLVLCWGAVGSPGFAGNLDISFWGFLSVPIIANTVLQVYKIVCWNLFQ